MGSYQGSYEVLISMFNFKGLLLISLCLFTFCMATTSFAQQAVSSDVVNTLTGRKAPQEIKDQTATNTR